MSGASRFGDLISGMTNGEHGGHYDAEGKPIHSASFISGTISGNCSPNVFINGKPVATIGSTTDEYDVCTNGNGVVSSGSSKVFINGKGCARIGDTVLPHNGTASITGGSSNVIIG